ncbi:rap1 GTPase-GDP dissociation stimulator 1-like isoform X3 [Gopherus flavomarginatus]|uniref:rap1 GTPase-GDP dissociation stimulator 1-like isoform X3 n=1 Tax=Gopherus flavomarginatus TaxID=286002 RepID=UPI0021CBAF56|nr:rap1 GTPase-GDP dissociation stimulator 1-like isoform X3 [Gopherus flavomarginatus]
MSDTFSKVLKHLPDFEQMNSSSDCICLKLGRRLSTLLNQDLDSKHCLDLYRNHEGKYSKSNSLLLLLTFFIIAGQRSSSLLTDTGIFPTLAQILKGNPRCAIKAAQVIAEIAKNEEMKKPCIDAGLVLALVPLLESTDQEMLLHAGRAIGRICYENSDLQEQLVEAGVITSLVRILTDYPDSEPLVHVNLLALCNLANLDALKVQMVEAGVHEALSEILLRLQGSSQAEDMCSVKAASNLIVSLLLGDESMQKMFANGCGIIYQKVGTWLASNHPQLQLTGALAVANFARNDGNCVRMVQLGVVLQLLDLLEQHVDNGDVSVQHAALSALRNLAIPVANKVQMLEEGVAERIQMLLRSEMAPVQFKLLGTLRMLIDGQADTAEMLGQDPLLINRLVQWCNAQEHAGVRGEANRLLASLLRHSRSQEVVKAIQQAQGVKHLVSMTTSEHVIMQNEALIALAIASAIHLEVIKDSLKESRLVQSLHKLLQDECTGPEVKYNSMGLLCSLLNSGDLKQEVEEDNIKETLEKLCSHSNANVVKQAVMTLQILRDESQNTGFVSP